MNKTDSIEKKQIFVSISTLSCVIFTLFSLLFNIFYSIILWPLLPNIAVNLITLLISFILSSIIMIFSIMIKKPFLIKKINFVFFSCILFTSIFVIFNISTVILKDVWNLYSILIILTLSFLISIVKFYVPIKSFIVKSIIYYIMISIPYFIITLAFGNYGAGNNFIIVFAIYTLIFLLCNIIIFTIKGIKKKAENENKQYTKQFK